jgi:hypothetical protein
MMTNNVLFTPVKEWGPRKETFIEHAIETYHVGKYLHTQLKLDLDRKKYLYACFFHDAGKLMIKLGKEGHTPRSREGLDLLKSTDAYEALIQNFELADYAGDEYVLASIEKHHNSDDFFSAFVSIADQIASSNSNDDLKNRLKKRAISSLVTYLNEMHGFGSTNFFALEIPSFSKNELNAVGRLLLLKLLYETIEGLDSDTHLLYETITGCRIATSHPKDELGNLVSSAFSANLVEFIRKQDLSKLIRGAPDGYRQLCTLPFELKPELERLTVLKYAQDIVKALKRHNLERLEDVGLDEDILLRFSNLNQLKRLSGSTSSFKYALLADTANRYSQWVADAFKLKRVETSARAGRPVLEELLEEAGADTEKITRREIVYGKICSMAKAISSIQGCDVEFRASVADYLTIDGGVAGGNIATANTCANCGTFEGTIPLETFTFGHRQHYRESLFRKTNSEVRDGGILVCDLCHVEALLNTLLSGITIENQRARVNTKTHLVLYGLDIDKQVINELADERLIERLLRDFKITQESIYVTRQTDLQIVLLSLVPWNVGIQNETYRHLLFSLIATRLREANPLILAFGVNKSPTVLNNELLQFSEKDAKILTGDQVDFFEYVFADVNTDYRRQRDYILRYKNDPFIGLAQIFKRESIRFGEQENEMVNKLAKDDSLYEITDQIWEMARIGGGLEPGKNVGSFLGVFQGKPEDLDRVVNKLLKNDKLSAEKRGQIIELHESARAALLALPEKRQRELKDYVQKTKYLFNSKKFYELKQTKGGS